MLNVHLSYKPLSYWRILFRSGGFSRQFSCMKRFRSLVVPGRGCRKDAIIQGIKLKRRFSYGSRSCLRIKGDVTGVSFHSYRPRNGPNIQVSRRSIYDTRRPEHPHLPIHQYERCPRYPPFTSPLQIL